MRIKYFYFLIVFAAFTQCGGSAGSIGQDSKEIILDFGDPEASFSLSASDYEYQFLVYSESDSGQNLVFGPADLTSYNSDENAYSVRADDLLFGNYTAAIRLVTIPAGDEDPLPVTQATFDLALTEKQLTLSLSNLDWDDSQFDDDLDGLSNMSELGLGTDPKNEDTDGDGVADGVDAFPKSASEAYDFDGDGFGDSQDDDIDNDGLSNQDEADLGTDPIQPDTDFDGLLDGSDNCALETNATQSDLDGDGIGDECDTDRDGDGLTDTQETSLGTSPTRADTDGDGVQDAADAFPTSASETADSDHDGTGDTSDTDDDNDGLSDTVETASGSNPDDSDSDDDGVRDGLDNCLLISNAGQADNDQDDLGDDCDDDDDNDGLSDVEESGIGTDGFITNTRLADSDGDGFSDDLDNCPNDDNIDQADADGDGFGSTCDCDDTDAAINQLANDLPDSTVADTNCDGIDGNRYESIFVATTGTVQASSTAYGSPTSDLQGAIEQAKDTGQSILIAAGDYNTGDLTIEDGISLYGGYQADFLVRDTLGQSQITRFINPESDDNGAGLSLVDLTDGVVLSGITFFNNSEDTDQIGVYVDGSAVDFENCVFSGNSAAQSETFLSVADSDVILQGSQFIGNASAASIGLNASDSQVSATNNLWTMGEAEHTRGIELDNVTGVLANNTVDGGHHSLGSAYALVMAGEVPRIINNVFVTENDRNQASIICAGLSPSDEVVLENNAFLRFTSRGLNYPAYVQCDGTGLYNDSDLSGSVALNASDNLVPTSGAASALATYLDTSNFYVPVSGSVLINTAQDSDSESDGGVLIDLYGQPRSSGSYDIGAVEF